MIENSPQNGKFIKIYFLKSIVADKNNNKRMISYLYFLFLKNKYNRETIIESQNKVLKTKIHKEYHRVHSY